MACRSFISKYGYRAGAGLLLLLFFLQSYGAVSRYPTYTRLTDQVHHLNGSILFSNQMDNVIFSDQPVAGKLFSALNGLKTFTLQKNWPTFTYLVTYCTGKLFGKGIVATEMGSLLFFAVILLVALYMLGKSFPGRNPGITAGLLLYSSPLVVLYSRGYGLDYPLMAVTTLTIALLVRTRYFSRPWWSMFFGISLGAGMLVKAQIVFYVLGPLIYSMWRGFFVGESQGERREIALRCAAALLIAALISSIWWSNKLQYIWSDLLSHARSEHNTAYIEPLTLRWAGYYLLAVLRGGNIFLLPLAFFGLYIMRKEKGAGCRGELFLWGLAPYILLTLIQTKAPRFVLPVLPAIALVASFGLHSIRSATIKTATVLCIAFLLLTEGLFIDPGNWYYHKTRTNYHQAITRIVETIGQWRAPGKQIVVGLVENREYFTTNTNAAVVCYFLSRSIPNSMCILSQTHREFFQAQSWDIDVLLVGEDADEPPAFPESVDDGSWKLRDQVTLLGEGTKVYIYKRSGTPE